jgi:hypothetical protein
LAYKASFNACAFESTFGWTFACKGCDYNSLNTLYSLPLNCTKHLAKQNIFALENWQPLLSACINQTKKSLLASKRYNST